MVVAHQAAAHTGQNEAYWLFEHGTSAAPARQWAHQILLEWQLPALLIEDALLVITELVQNVAQHTGDGGRLTLTRDQGIVVIEVTDFCPDLPQIRPPDPRRPGGRGLPIVAALSHDWGIRPAPASAGKTVWALITTTSPR
ncbi:ATP-binding protein [Actinoplanes sp. CA-015351]|uniref:ATP-binding protein n=1 Tax=Actinoplanes sp. CA-015351 TaxID=3239897 RepID=UPI003D99A02F